MMFDKMMAAWQETMGKLLKSIDVLTGEIRGLREDLKKARK